MKRLLRLPLFMLYLLVPTVLTAAAYLIYSDSGTSLLFNFANRLTAGALQVQSVSGPLSGPLVLDGLMYEDTHVRVELDHVELDWNLYALAWQRLEVESLKATRLQVRIKETPPDPEPKDSLTQLPLALLLNQLQLDLFELQIGDAQPLRFETLQLSADWVGNLITARSLSTNFQPLGALDFSGDLRMEPRQLSILQARLGGYGELNLQGVIGYHGDFSADAQWKNLRWPQAGEAQVLCPVGKAKASGTWSQYQLQLDSQLLVEQMPLTMLAKGIGSTADLQLQELQAQVLGGTVEAEGGITWSPSLKIEAQGTARQLNPAQRWPQWPGRLGGDFEAQLESLAAGMQAQFTLDLRDSQLRGYPFSLQLDGQQQADVLSFKQLELRSGDSDLKVSGRALPTFDLKAALNSPNLANLWPELRGRAEISATLLGSREQPQLRAQGQLQRAGYGEYSIEQMTIETDLHPLKLSRVDVTAQNLKLGIDIPSAEIHADGTAAQHQLQFKTRTAAGAIELGFRGALDLQSRQWQGQLASGRGTPLQLPSWTLQEPAKLRLSRTGSVLEPACWRSETSRACAQFNQQPQRSKVAFRLEDWAFAYFQTFLPPQWSMSGAVSGTGMLTFDAEGLHQASADLSTTAGELKVGKQIALAFQPSSFQLSDAAGGLKAMLSVPMEQGGISAGATLAASGAPEHRKLSGSVKLDFRDLTPLRILSTELETVSGELRGEFQLSGTAARPRSEGVMRLSGGGVRLATPGITLSEVQAELRSSARSDVIELNASASSGGGTLKLQGQTDPQAPSKILSLKIVGENFQAMNTPQARVWVSPDLNFDLARERADLSGEVQVPRAEIMPRTFAQGIGPSRDQMILGPQGESAEAGLLKIYSKVRISLGDNVRFEGFGLKSKFQGAINATDEPGRPTQARGEIRLLEGRYKAYGQDLSIETGRLLFNGGLITDPAIELRAVRRPADDISVGIFVRGTLASPKFSLFSTPDMPQDQQLSWLVLGRGIEAKATAGERSAVSDAALSLGLSGGNYLTQKFGGGLKLDEISIASKPGQTADQAQFTIGKYLSPKLYISYGIGLFQPGHSFRLLYDIGKYFKLSTESGIESGGDLLFAIER